MKSIKDLFVGARPRNYKKGQVIIHQGDQLDYVYLIKKGYVKLYSILESGDERILLLMGPGHAFPMTTSLQRPDYEIKYFYEAMTDLEVLYMDREKFASQNLEENYRAIQVFLEYVTRFNRYVMQHLEVLESKSAHDKLRRVLPQLMEKFGKEIKKGCVELKIRLTHQDIANMTGLTRETASIQIKKLEDEGVLEQYRGRLRINTKRLTS